MSDITYEIKDHPRQDRSKIVFSQDYQELFDYILSTKGDRDVNTMYLNVVDEGEKPMLIVFNEDVSHFNTQIKEFINNVDRCTAVVNNKKKVHSLHIAEINCLEAVRLFNESYLTEDKRRLINCGKRYFVESEILTINEAKYLDGSTVLDYFATYSQKGRDGMEYIRLFKESISL